MNAKRSLGLYCKKSGRGAVHMSMDGAAALIYRQKKIEKEIKQKKIQKQINKNLMWHKGFFAKCKIFWQNCILKDEIEQLEKDLRVK